MHRYGVARAWELANAAAAYPRQELRRNGGGVLELQEIWARRQQQQLRARGFFLMARGGAAIAQRRGFASLRAEGIEEGDAAGPKGEEEIGLVVETNELPTELGVETVVEAVEDDVAAPAVSIKPSGDEGNAASPTTSKAKVVVVTDSASSQRLENGDVDQDVAPVSKSKSEEAKVAVSSSAPVSTPPTVDARLARKLRRIQEGKFRPTARTATEEERAGIVGSVLEKIARMDGPPIPESQSRKPKEKRTESEMEEVKRKKNLKVSKKQDRSADNKKEDTKPAQHEKDIWQIQKAALSRKFGEVGWQPRKRLSPDTLEGIRALHASDPTTYATEVLAEHFKVTPEAIRRILKSKWKPSEGEVEDRRVRWEKRGNRKRGEIGEQAARRREKRERMNAASGGGDRPRWSSERRGGEGKERGRRAGRESGGYIPFDEEHV